VRRGSGRRSSCGLLPGSRPGSPTDGEPVPEQKALGMPHHDPFEMDFDGDVDAIDSVGFDYLVRHMLGFRSTSSNHLMPQEPECCA
jgi:hypothetical protein